MHNNELPANAGLRSHFSSSQNCLAAQSKRKVVGFAAISFWN